LSATAFMSIACALVLRAKVNRKSG
jgi:hypothetical protein